MEHGDFRGILNYIPQFRGKIFVLAVDGDVLEEKYLSDLLVDLGVMHSLNIKVIIVHGGAKQIKAESESRDLSPSCCHGVGPTDEPTLKLSVDVITGLTFSLVQRLKTVGVNAVSGNFFDALPKGIYKGVESESTGVISNLDSPQLLDLLDAGMMPVVAPLSQNAAGELLRLDAYHVASKLAVAVGAFKLMFLNSISTEKSLGTDSKELSLDDASEQMKSVEGLQREQLKEGVQACRGGVPRVHFLDATVHGAVLTELFENEGVGAMIYANDYRIIRKMTEVDIPYVLGMMEDSVEDDAIVRRSHEFISSVIDQFYVLELDKHIIGCVSLKPYPKSKIAEIGSLFIHRSHRRLGNGKRLVDFVEEEARNAGVKKVYALTTQAAGFFSVAPYEKGEIKDLPKDRREELLATGRNSKVFVRAL